MKKIGILALLIFSSFFIIGCKNKPINQEDNYIIDEENGVQFTEHEVSDEFIEFFDNIYVSNLVVHGDYIFVMHSDIGVSFQGKISCLTTDEVLWTIDGFHYVREFKKLDEDKFLVSVSNGYPDFQSFIVGIDGEKEYEMGNTGSDPILTEDFILAVEVSTWNNNKRNFTLMKVYEDSSEILRDFGYLYNGELFHLTEDRVLFSYKDDDGVKEIILDYDGNILYEETFPSESETYVKDNWIIINDRENETLYTFDFEMNQISSIFFNTYANNFNVDFEIYYNPWQDYTVYIDENGILKEDTEKVKPNRLYRVIGYQDTTSIYFNYDSDFFALDENKEIIWEYNLENRIHSIFYEDGITSITSNGYFKQYNIDGDNTSSVRIGSIIYLQTSNNHYVGIDGPRGYDNIYMYDEDFNVLWNTAAKSKISEIHETAEGNILVSYYSFYDSGEDFAYGDNLSQLYSPGGALLKDYTTEYMSGFAFNLFGKTYLEQNGSIGSIGYAEDSNRTIQEIDEYGEIVNEYNLLLKKHGIGGLKEYYVIKDGKLVIYKKMIQYHYPH